MYAQRLLFKRQKGVASVGYNPPTVIGEGYLFDRTHAWKFEPPFWHGERRGRASYDMAERDELREIVHERLAFLSSCESACAVLGECDRHDGEGVVFNPDDTASHVVQLQHIVAVPDVGWLPGWDRQKVGA